MLRKEQVRPKSTEVTVTQHEVEDLPQKPKYSKDLDIGRIVIEEIPEEIKDLPNVHRIEKDATKSTEVTLTRHEVEDISTVKEGILKLGKLDVTWLELHVLASTNVGERTNADSTQKVIIEHV
jgi:hypothetical protein